MFDCLESVTVLLRFGYGRVRGGRRPGPPGGDVCFGPWRPQCRRRRSTLPISRPAVSRHLRVLLEARLVRDELVGRRRVYRLDVEGLAPVTAG